MHAARIAHLSYIDYLLFFQRLNFNLKIGVPSVSCWRGAGFRTLPSVYPYLVCPIEFKYGALG